MTKLEDSASTTSQGDNRLERCNQLLITLCRKLAVEAERVLAQRIRTDSTDHLAFMSAVFATPQVDHLVGVVALVEAGCFAQSGILARSMLEGYGLLAWAHRDKQRALQWRASSLVHDLRLLREMESAGKHVDSRMEADLVGRLKKEGRGLLTRKARKEPFDLVASDQSSYARVWHVEEDGTQRKISDILKEMNGGLRALYSQFSQYVHWDVAGLARHIQPTKTGFRFSPADQSHAFKAMVLAFSTCWDTMDFVVCDLSLDKSSLDELRSAFLKDIGPPGSPQRPPGL